MRRKARARRRRSTTEAPTHSRGIEWRELAAQPPVLPISHSADNVTRTCRDGGRPQPGSMRVRRKGFLRREASRSSGASTAELLNPQLHRSDDRQNGHPARHPVARKSRLRRFLRCSGEASHSVITWRGVALCAKARFSADPAVPRATNADRPSVSARVVVESRTACNVTRLGGRRAGQSRIELERTPTAVAARGVDETPHRPHATRGRSRRPRQRQRKRRMRSWVPRTPVRTPHPPAGRARPAPRRHPSLHERHAYTRECRNGCRNTVARRVPVRTRRDHADD